MKPLQCMGSRASTVMDAAEPGAEAESGSAGRGGRLPSSRYKGVVPQPNGRWGAHIYQRHQRVYDAAAQRLRGLDAVTNFGPLAVSDLDDAAEFCFFAAWSKAEVVDMLRKQTYPDELVQQKRAFFAATEASSPLTSSPSLAAAPSPAAWREHLFDKTVTPSDMGKLNRLVIPKQHAEKHFPLQLPSGECKGVLLNFEDVAGKAWKFRYSY